MQGCTNMDDRDLTLQCRCAIQFIYISVVEPLGGSQELVLPLLYRIPSHRNGHSERTSKRRAERSAPVRGQQEPLDLLWIARYRVEIFI